MDRGAVLIPGFLFGPYQPLLFYGFLILAVIGLLVGLVRK